MNQPAPDVLTDPPRRNRARLAERRPPRLAGWAALLVVWVVWGSTYPAIRVADRTIPPFPMAGVRYLIAGLLLYPTAWLTGRRGPHARAQPYQPGSRARGPLAQWAEMAVVGTLLGERLTVTALLGGAIVVVSVALLLSGRSREDS